MSANQKPHSKLQEKIAEIYRLEGIVIDTRNLIIALQLLCEDLGSYRTFDPDLSKLRAAIIGISDALDARTKEVPE